MSFGKNAFNARSLVLTFSSIALTGAVLLIGVRSIAQSARFHNPPEAAAQSKTLIPVNNRRSKLGHSFMRIIALRVTG
jgi:hypothetical protein